MYVFEYTVEFDNPIEEDICKESGIIFGSCLANAAENLEQYYGKSELISILNLSWTDIDAPYVLSSEMLKDLGYEKF